MSIANIDEKRKKYSAKKKKKHSEIYVYLNWNIFANLMANYKR